MARASVASRAICAFSPSRSSNSISSRRKPDQLDLDALAVKLLVEIEEIGLEQLLGGSNIGRVPRLATPSSRRPSAKPAAHRIDAEARPLVAVERDVGGRIAELAASLVAMLDHALDRERAG